VVVFRFYSSKGRAISKTENRNMPQTKTSKPINESDKQPGDYDSQCTRLVEQINDARSRIIGIELIQKETHKAVAKEEALIDQWSKSLNSLKKRQKANISSINLTLPGIYNWVWPLADKIRFVLRERPMTLNELACDINERNGGVHVLNPSLYYSEIDKLLKLGLIQLTKDMKYYNPHK